MREYANYGGRGISVCERWATSFEAFLEDMGTKPSPKHSIDRIDNNGNYEPGNCRWATTKEQNWNKRNNVFLEHNGIRLPLTEWARRAGVDQGYLSRRIASGMPVEKALKLSA